MTRASGPGIIGSVGKVTRFWTRGRRLKGLEEFERPGFVGRMARVQRRRQVAWWAMMAGGVAIGVGLGLVLF